MNEASRLKVGGYLVSMASVVLLGIPAFESALKHPLLLASLIAGMFLSVAGMALRWRAHRTEQREKERG